MLIVTLIILRNIFYRQAHGWKQSIKKTLVDNLWYIGDSISNKFIDRLKIDKAHQKNLPVSLCQYIHQ
jgi:hypothetical protein